MRPFETIASVTTPDGKALTLHRHDRDYYIHLDGEELMSTRRHGSEAALAEVALRDLRAAAPRVLIGGLGLGFTLRAALDLLAAEARVVVAEIFPAVVVWNREELAALGRPLDDPRVGVREEDVAVVLTAAGEGAWDAILLDVDNGPSAFCLESNDRLYDRRGLARLRRSLRPGGVLAVWSAYPGAAFLKQLRKAGFDARMETARARGRKGVRSFLYVGSPR